MDLPSTLPDRKRHTAKAAPPEDSSVHGGARHSRLSRQISDRESPTRSALW